MGERKDEEKSEIRRRDDELEDRDNNKPQGAHTPAQIQLRRDGRLSPSVTSLTRSLVPTLHEENYNLLLRLSSHAHYRHSSILSLTAIAPFLNTVLPPLRFLSSSLQPSSHLAPSSLPSQLPFKKTALIHTS